MKNIVAIISCFCLLTVALSLTSLFGQAQITPSIENRINLGFQITASGTPFRISKTPLKMDRMHIEAWPASPYGSNTGTITIMLGVPVGTTCNSSNLQQISGKVIPGGDFSDPQGATGDQIQEFEDLSLACLDGTVNGDYVTVSGWQHGR